MPSCSLVIRSFNEANHIGRLLEGVRQQSLKDVEIILVDSGSTDDTVAIAQKHGARVERIHSEEFTFGRSLNIGLSTATCEWVVIASAHVYPVYPDWLDRLLYPLKDPTVALAYGRQRGAEDCLFSEQQIFLRWYPDQSNTHQDHPFCNNANAAVRRSLWEKQHYDETLSGLEDLAWAKAALHLGYSISYVAEAEVIHVHHETPPAVLHRYMRESMAFKQLYPEAHFNAYDLLRNVFSSIGFDLLHACRQRRLLVSFSSIIWFRLAQFLGTYRGYRLSRGITSELRQTFYYHVGWERSAPKVRKVKPIKYYD